MSKKIKFKFSKGSVLVFTLIVLFIVLASAIGISSVSVLERKGAGSSDVSVQSFQIANSGAEIILKKIDANKSGTFADIGCDAVNGGKISGNISSGKNYEITFYKNDGLQITECTTDVSEIDKIKSIGSYANTTRAIEVAVAATVNVVQVFNMQAGGLPLTSSEFTVSGSNLIIFASGSGWASSADSTIGMEVYLDTAKVGELKAFTNESSSHKAFVSNPIVVTGVTSGTHKIDLKALGSTNSDSNDYFSVTVLGH